MQQRGGLCARPAREGRTHLKPTSPQQRTWGIYGIKKKAAGDQEHGEEGSEKDTRTGGSTQTSCTCMFRGRSFRPSAVKRAPRVGHSACSQLKGP